MRVVLQRVKEASVRIDGALFSKIGHGLLIFLGLHRDDTDGDAEWIIKKIVQARIFQNPEGKMSHSVVDIGGEILVVSQVTLYGDLLKGNRPDMGLSMKPSEARPFYEGFVEKLKTASALKVATGQFAALMDVQLQNDGPVTLILDSFQRK